VGGFDLQSDREDLAAGHGLGRINIATRNRSECAMLEAATHDFPILSTSRLNLRAVTPDDSAPFQALLSIPEVIRYSNWPDAPNEDQASRLVQNMSKLFFAGDGWAWIIEDRSSRDFISAILFNYFLVDKVRRMERRGSKGEHRFLPFYPDPFRLIFTTSVKSRGCRLRGASPLLGMRHNDRASARHCHLRSSVFYYVTDADTVRQATEWSPSRRSRRPSTRC